MDYFTRKEPFFRSNQRLLEAWSSNPSSQVIRAAKRWRVVRFQCAMIRLFPKLYNLYRSLRYKVYGIEFGSPVLTHKLVTKQKE